MLALDEWLPLLIDVCGPCAVDVFCVYRLAPPCVHEYVCVQFICKCMIPGLMDQGRYKSVSLLCLPGSGLPSRAHRYVCVLISVTF